MRLSDLPVGATGSISSIESSAPEPVAMRLRHLGFRVGNDVTAVRTAPLGDPTLYHILGYDMCLRAHEACHIRIVRQS